MGWGDGADPIAAEDGYIKEFGLQPAHFPDQSPQPGSPVRISF